MNGAVKWSHESTREFIQLRYKLRHRFNGRKHHCEKAYSHIVEELGLSSVITPEQARKKWSNLMQKYMDIKGGYSTASEDWPYFQLLDQVVPLMRKEKIEKQGNETTSTCDQTAMSPPQELLPSPCSDPDPLTNSEEGSVATGKKVCKVEPGVGGEPPRKRGRVRRTAQRARDRWWGAVEDEDLGSSSPGPGARPGDEASHSSHKSSDNMDPSHTELHTLKLLESCSASLVEVKDTLRSHSQCQEAFMQSLQDVVLSQSNAIKELLSTITSQNNTLISLMSRATTKNSSHSLGIEGSSAYSDHSKQLRQQQQEGQLLVTQHNLMSALSQEAQACTNPLTGSSELSDDMTGL